MKTTPTPGVREDFKTGQYFPTLNGKDISPSTFDETRALEIAEQAAKTPEIQKVLFRADRRKPHTVSAVLVGQPGSWKSPLTVWDSSSGHGAGSWEWYYSTRPATPAEYADELKRLRRQYAPEYVIQVVKRYTRKDRDALHAQF